MREYLDTIERVVAQGPYTDSWESLSQIGPPRWFNRLKLGIFIHWGVYSVPAFDNEWYPRNMYMPGSRAFEHHAAAYGPQKDFGYKDFIPMFRAERFDPEAWAQLFADTGARYVVPVAEHHDGFQMYRSDLSHWNAFEMGPKRDVLGELCAACGAKGLVMGASSHRIEHWFFLGHGREFESDIHEPLRRGDLYWPSVPVEGDDLDTLDARPAPTREFLEDWLVRTCELIDRYRPRILYFDWWIQQRAAKPYLKKLAAYYYNRAAQWGVEVVIAYKHDAFLFGCAMPDMERGQFADMKGYYWQSDTAIALNSWCHTVENRYKDAADIVRDLADVVSKNGCMLLNVGPKADGTISDEDRRVMEAIGAWMKVNGEAIYDARTWRTFGEGPTQVMEGQFSDGVKKAFTSADFRFTAKGGALYAIAMKPDDGGDYCVKALAEAPAEVAPRFHGVVRDVGVLGGAGEVRWHRDGQGLHIHTDCRMGDMPVTFRIALD